MVAPAASRRADRPRRATWSARPVAARVVVVGEPPREGELSYDDLRAGRGAAGAAAARPGEARRAALHQRHLGPPAGRDAEPPRAARQHRAGRRGRAADDARRRRRARRAAAVPRLRPQRGARRRAAAPRQAGAGRALRPAGHPRPDRGRGVQRGAGRAAGVRRTGARRGPRASGSARCGWCCPARRRCRPSVDRRVHRRAPASRPPGLRADRGGAGGHQHAVQRSSSRPARSARRCPASSIRLVDDAGARRPRARTPARSRSGATTCSAATGPTAPTVPTPTAGGRPATSASSTQPATCSWSTGSRSWSSSPASTSTRSRSRT